MMIMITGIGVLGLLAGSMASFFHIGDGARTSPADAITDDSQPRDALTNEIVELRTHVGHLIDEVARLTAPGTAPGHSP